MYLQALVRDLDNGEIRNMLETVERHLSAVCYIVAHAILLTVLIRFSLF